MACYHLLDAYRDRSGAIKFGSPLVSKGGRSLYERLQIPCGQCVGCRLERSRQWAMRCLHESSLHEENCFITLTYNDENLPSDLSLNYKHFQDFMKRFRKAFGPDIRFYMCGEYGEKFDRPHFHACIFGFDFDDKQLFFTSPSGAKVYRSAKLEKLWKYGYSSIGDVTFESAAYVARYIMKKQTGQDAERRYEMTCLETGEIVKRKPEFNNMSRRPGIASDWFDKFSSDVYPHDFVVVNGKRCRPPKYYDRKLARLNPDLFEEIATSREKLASLRSDNNTPERLAVREEVVNLKVQKLARKIQ